MENEIYEVLESYKNALDNLLDRLEAMEQRNQELEGEVQRLNSTLFDEILAPAQAAVEKADKDARFEEFNGKYGEQLAPIADKANAIEGDENFDFVREAFDNYDAMEVPEGEEKPSEDEYVETLVAVTQEKIDAIKSALGADEVEVKVDEEGDVEVKADGEDVTDEVTDEEGEIKTEEEIEETVSPEEETETVEETEEEEEPTDDDEEVAELEAQLEKELENYK